MNRQTPLNAFRLDNTFHVTSVACFDDEYHRKALSVVMGGFGIDCAGLSIEID